MRYKRIVISMLFIVAISTGTFTYAAPVNKSIELLKKQISTLQQQLKVTQQQLSSKDILIKDLKKQLDEKDKTIKEYQSKNYVQPLDINYSFDGVKIDDKDSISVPQAFIYKDILYSPTKFIGNNLEKIVTYDEKLKTIYIDTKQKEQYMSDILAPVYFQVGYALFSKDTSTYMTISGKKYYNGYCMFSDTSNRNIPSKMTFNLEGKYENIKGLIGLQDGQENENARVEVYGDNKLLVWYQVSSGSQPLVFDVDVKGLQTLDIVKYNTGTANLVNLIIK